MEEHGLAPTAEREGGEYRAVTGALPMAREKTLDQCARWDAWLLEEEGKKKKTKESNSGRHYEELPSGELEGTFMRRRKGSTEEKRCER